MGNSQKPANKPLSGPGGGGERGGEGDEGMGKKRKNEERKLTLGYQKEIVTFLFFFPFLLPFPFPFSFLPSFSFLSFPHEDRNKIFLFFFLWFFDFHGVICDFIACFFCLFVFGGVGGGCGFVCYL